MPITKEKMLDCLPIKVGDFTIRSRHRNDLDLMTDWPKYPASYESFNASFVKMRTEEKDQLFAQKNADPTRLMMMVDHKTQLAIVDLYIKDTDWQTGKIGCIGIRVHPQWCDKGVGTLVIRAMAKWAFELGITSIGLDVSAANARAVTCYEKVGFVRTGDWWRDDPYLNTIDISQPQYSNLLPHIRLDAPIPQTRFYLMELTPEALK